MTDCFRCGDDDHLSYDCPARTPRTKTPAPAPRAAPGAGQGNAPPPFTHLTRREPDPPAAAYLEERQRLGMTSRSAALAVACPWCGAGVYGQCQNPGTGRETAPHQARRDLADGLPAEREVNPAYLDAVRARYRPGA